MAWRIDEHVIRGEIDNRTRGRTWGRIWFVGRPAPVELDLKGDCWRDLAGRRLEFSNPEPKPGLLGSFYPDQNGLVGDITASRKVKVPEVSMDELMKLYEQRKPFPWHWGNSLYLEWFSQRNGRVMIESASFELRIMGEPTWEMTSEEEIEQRRSNASAMTGFMDRLVEAVGESARSEPAASYEPENQEKDKSPGQEGSRVMSEEEAEAMQARSDLLADRIQARMEREGPEADYERILDEELERLRNERGEPEPTAEDLARNAEWIEEANRASEEALQDPENKEDMEAEWEDSHPLVERVSEFALRMRRTAEAEGWRPEGASSEHPVAELLDATLIAGPKLAGALNGREWPPPVEFCALDLVRLKRARGYLEDALRAADSCQEDGLIPPAHLEPISNELTNLAREVDDLIAELRAKLERGMD